MKKVMIILFVCFGIKSVMATPVLKTDEASLIQLIDSLSAALVKQDKVWLTANLTAECSLTDPNGQTLEKADFIKAFSPGGIYTLAKMLPSGMKYTINDAEALGVGSIELEGVMSAQEVIDVSGTYSIQTDFKKTDSGWKISAIRVSQ
jgi:hypothetical protein